MAEWIDLIPNQTIKGTVNPFEFTRKAGRSIQSLISKEDFSEEDSKAILGYLRRQADLVPFGVYLKRYIYLRYGMKERFDLIPDETYKTLLKEAFSRTHTPRSFHRTTTTLGVLVSGWLTAVTVSRETVFILGFALEMTAEDVSMFLTKAICEQDFNMGDPEEIIYWFCYKNGLPAMHALALMEVYQNTPVPASSVQKRPAASFRYTMPGREEAVSFLDGPTVSGRFRLLSENMDEGELLHYLTDLKIDQGSGRFSKTAYNCFVSLLDHAKDEIDSLNHEADLYVFGKLQAHKQIREAEVERVLYSGVPVDRKGNLMNISFSSLSKGFAKHRLTRQRMSRILAGKAAVSRYDLITLLFLGFVLRDEDDPIPRYKKFVKTANALLEHCYMGKLNISNLYEAYILVCLLTEDPLSAFSEVWELSYNTANDLG